MERFFGVKTASTDPRGEPQGLTAGIFSAAAGRRTAVPRNLIRGTSHAR
jgi:hypothetical protein